jgi:hypothetical protein
VTQFFNNILNPILVRELRQFVRNRFIVLLVNLYIVALVTACLVILAFDPYGVSSSIVGYALLITLAVITYITNLLAVVVRTIVITSNDKLSEDLMFFTSMTPTTIVLGKIFSGIVFSLILMSATMPFVTLAYLLRGVDLQTVMWMFATIFIVVQILNSMAIFAAVSSEKTNTSITGQVILSCFVMFIISFIILPWLFPYISSLSMSPRFLVNFFCFVLLSCECIAMIILASASLLSPPASNKMFPIRVLLMSVFLINVIILVGISRIFAGTLSMDIYVYIETVALIVLIIMIGKAALEQDQWSNRIRRNLPKSRLQRAVLFPFCSGAANGVVWVIIMMLIVGILENVLLSRTDIVYFKIEDDGNGVRLPLLLGGFIFAFDYAVTEMLIRIRIFKRLRPKNKVSFIFIGLLLFFTLGSYLVYLFFEAEIGVSYSDSFLSALNPFYDVFSIENNDGTYKNIRVVGMSVWLVLLLIMLARWYSRKIREFTPDFKEELSYDEARNFVQELEGTKKYTIDDIFSPTTPTP